MGRWLPIVVMLAGCGSLDEVMLIVEVEPGWSEPRVLDIEIRSDEQIRFDRSRALDASEETRVLLRRGAEERPEFEARLWLRGPDDTVLSERVVRARYVSGERRYLRVRLTPDCVDVRCAGDDTCAAGRCTSSCRETTQEPASFAPACAGRMDGGLEDADVSFSDAGVPDAGVPDAGAPDAGYDPSALDCSALPGVIFCEDFESGELPGGVRSWPSGGSEVVEEVTEGDASRGQRAWRITVNEPGAGLSRAIALAHDADELWVRLFVRHPAEPVLERQFDDAGVTLGLPRADLLAFGEIDSRLEYRTVPLTYIAWRGYGLSLVIGDVLDGGLSEDRLTPNLSIEPGAWHCVLLHVPAPGLASLRRTPIVGGAVVAEGTNTLQPSALRTMHLGLLDPSANPAGRSYDIDDVVVSLRPLACR